MSKSKGNVVTPRGPARGVRLGRRPLLGGRRPAGHRHRLRHEPDARRPPPGDEGAQRQPLRARHVRGRRPARPGRRHRPPGPRAARGARGRRPGRDGGARRLRLHPRAGAHRALLLVLLRRLRRAGEVPRVRRGGRGRGAVGARHARGGALGAAAAAGAGAAVRHRGGVVLVARRLRPPGAVAGGRGRQEAPTPACSTSARGCWRRCAARSPRRRCRCAPRCRRSS